MPLYIGDYLAATAHLDALESGAYLHLLMHQWKNGKLPSESDGLRRIAKVDRDAWSNAWLLLTPFFDYTQGFPVQLRLEKIREEWRCKQLKAQEKAKTAAAVRWQRDAPSITHALHETCPSSSPSSSPIVTTTNTYPTTPKIGVLDDHSKEEAKRLKVEVRAAAKKLKDEAKAAAKAELRKMAAAKKISMKAAKPPTKTELTQSRHSEFKVAIFEYWKSKNPEIDCPWQQAEGMQLELWLKSSPTTTITKFKEMLRNRYRSEVVHSERPSVWIKNITSYANGPLNTYRQSLNGGKVNGKTDRAVEIATKLFNEFENNAGANGGELLPGG